ncbi:oxidoreductase [Mycolicibacterium setense]|uniref:SDR family oxidoreductase n=1 Tax=Mycolicibacterium setense TaxID=431269 RepID=UPI0007EAE400|nr:SDR family NAD(P)-dependent oxidoreductase [Mycolicibacterium setense]OBB20083.1 oxidoreductase [Mycolicibacterium setense]
MELTDRTWLITGGATGIGLALAKAVGARGNRVIICGRNQANLDRACSEDPNLIARQCDIADGASRGALVSWLAAEYPDLSVLVNNAGIQIPRDFRAGDAARELDAEIATNLAAPVHLIDELLPQLRRQPAATIINVTSGLAFAPLAVFPVYCATKAALHSFTLSLRHQLRGSPVEVIEMAPPIVASGLRSQASAERNPAASVAVTAEEFVADALPLLERGDAEVLVGQSAGTRREGEALFDRMNP